MSPSSESSSHSSCDSGSDTSSKELDNDSDSNTVYEVTSVTSSGDTEPSMLSLPETVKVKCARHKKLKR